jgi:hypothetical protein
MQSWSSLKHAKWHLQIANRWIVQYNFYINDRRWGRMFVRISPYSICLVFLKLFERVYARSPLAFSDPSVADARIHHPKRSQLDLENPC